MPFQTGRKRTAGKNLEKARACLRARRDSTEETCAANGSGSSDITFDASNLTLTDQESSVIHAEDPIVGSELHDFDYEMDLSFNVDAHGSANINESEIPVTSSPPSGMPPIGCHCDIKTLLDEKTAELSLCSDMISDLRAELIQSRKLKENVEIKNTRIQLMIQKTRLARDEYRIQVKRILKKIEKISNEKNFKRNLNKKFSRNSSGTYKYSELVNSTTKKKRKIAVVRAMQKIAREDDISKLLDDVIKFCDECLEQSFHFKLSLWQGACLKSKANLTGNQLETIKQLLLEFIDKDIFPSIKAIAHLQKCESKVDLFEGSETKGAKGETVSIVQCVNINELLSWRLSEIGEDLLFDDYSGDDIVVAFGGDAGGGSTKLCLIIGNMSNPNSVDSIMVIAMFNAPDTYESIKNLVPRIVEQFNGLTNVTYEINGTKITRRVRKKIIGDFKFIGENLNHKKQSANNYCFYCVVDKRKAGRKLMKHLNVNQIDDTRTIKSFTDFGKWGGWGVNKGDGPLFPTVNLFDHLIGPLHLVVGLFDRYIFKPLLVICAKMDNISSFDILADRTATTNAAEAKILKVQKDIEKCVDMRRKTQLQAGLKQLKLEKLKLEKVLNGVPNGKVKQLEQCWEKIGASRQAFFQSFSGNHIRKLLTPEGIRKTFDIFQGIMTDELFGLESAMMELSKIMSLTANRLLSSDDVNQIQQSSWNLAAFLADIAPEDTITQKLHTLLFHVPELARTHKSLGRICEQGIEAVHAKCNRIDKRLSYCRNRTKRFQFTVKELICSTVANDFLKAWYFEH
ncbi:hypothetical protein CAEBREN_04271 [Caenorhabditis brenneri]|uniref:Uncharacterized protein n=1 Tax=Caenorhabditis brenneri TaxID=135651 RepID=G0MWY8_CAEBE|nr:hypothetical protein CAEBREN_04271 [Caenorhabditis brenneri]